MKEHSTAFDQLDANYLTALERLLGLQTASARLETAIQVQQEIDLFRNRAEVDEALIRERMIDSFPELERLQSTYLDERARITNAQRAGVVAVLREYERRLEQSHFPLSNGRFDDVGKPLWESFGLAQHDEGGSEWVQTAEQDAWVVYGFVLTPDMFPRPR